MTESRRMLSPEQFLAGGPLRRDLLQHFNTNLMHGALDIVRVNEEVFRPVKYGNYEEKIRTVLAQSALVAGGIAFGCDGGDFLVHDIQESCRPIDRTVEAQAGSQNQYESLALWADHLARAEYEDWFRVYVWQSLKKMGTYQHERAQFSRRSASTLQSFPECDEVAVERAHEMIRVYLSGSDSTETTLTNKEVELLRVGNFAAIYAHTYTQERQRQHDYEVQQGVRGEWRTYHASLYDDDFGEPRRIVDDLRRAHTGWCTDDIGTASQQLAEGKIEVYYTSDEQRESPRVAVRYVGERVVEVRGILARQAVEDEFLPFVVERLGQAKCVDTGVQEGLSQAWQIARLAEKRARGEEFDASDVRTLWFSGDIAGFSVRSPMYWGSLDARIEEWRSERSYADDVALVLKSGASVRELVFSEKDVVAHATKLCEKGLVITELIPAYSHIKNLNELIVAGVPASKLMNKATFARQLNELVDLGMQLDVGVFVQQAITWRDIYGIDQVLRCIPELLAAGSSVRPEAIVYMLLREGMGKLVQESMLQLVAAGLEWDTLGDIVQVVSTPVELRRSLLGHPIWHRISRQSE